MTPYVKFLTKDTLLEDPKVKSNVRAKAFDYCIVDKGLYWRGKSGPDLKCLCKEEVVTALKK